MKDKELFARAAKKAELRPKTLVHTHSWACTYEVCGVGPKRADLIARSLRRNEVV